ncbi:MAG TPA: hypothetical protein VD995_25935 [Azospirillum sp.]|nr:hypothetical protein [Azospirillum sp.]
MPARLPATVLALVLSTALLCLPALYNGFPLVFSDTGTYIAQALQGFAGGNRPVFYSLFMMPLHGGGVSLWPVVVVQSLIVAHLLHLVIRVAVPGAGPWWTLAAAALLTVGTSLPWHTGQLMPDVFTSVLILTAFLLGFGLDRLSRLEAAYLVLLATGAVAVHFSHVPLAVGLLLVVLAVRLARRDAAAAVVRAALALAVPVVLAVAAMVSVTAAAHGEARLARDGDLFLLARMLSDGPARDYLADVCPAKPYRLCPYLDGITPDSNDFLWKPDSPLYKAGGPQAVREEAAAIIRGTLAAYPGRQVLAALRNFAEQFVTARSADRLHPFIGEDVQPDPSIRQHFPASHAAYTASLQSTGQLPIDAIRRLHGPLTLAGAAAAAAGFAWFLRRGERHGTALFVVILAGLMGNAFITGALSSVRDRYQSRVVWLVVFFALVAGLSAILSRQKERGRQRVLPAPEGVPNR